MLRVITLYTIHEILKESKLTGAQSKMIYISCLIKHFEKLEPSVENATDFDMPINAAQYDKFSKAYLNIQAAGLITINPNHIHFNNLWGQHIDRLLLNQDQDPDGTINGVLVWQEQLGNNQRMKDHVRRVYKLSEIQYKELIEQFISEQAASKRQYTSESDVLSHFQNWSKYNVEKPAHEVVKSNSKRLGDEKE